MAVYIVAEFVLKMAVLPESVLGLAVSKITKMQKHKQKNSTKDSALPTKQSSDVLGGWGCICNMIFSTVFHC